MAHQLVVVLDFGSQYTQLIARRIREQNVYCEIHPYTLAKDPAKLRELNPIGVVLSGGPSSVYEEGAPQVPASLFDIGVPILGICYGAQLVARVLGGIVNAADRREYGRATVRVLEAGAGGGVFRNLAAGEELAVWASHGDHVDGLPAGFIHTAESDNCKFSGFVSEAKRIHCVQFHPEVVHTPRGAELLGNFLFGICNAKGDWSMASFVDEAVAKIRAQVGNDGRVICGLSGGVDSSVAAALIHKAIGDRLTCIFVDNGVMRLDEASQIQQRFERLHLPLVFADASSLFLDRLAGVTDPEKKRKIIGAAFIEVFEAETKKLAERQGSFDFLAQGTLYPDVIESVSVIGPSHVIKSHHNVGGLPERMHFKLVEPLRQLFKDEVRAVGKEMGLDDEFVWRQPFPGPGLAVRILGEVSPARLDLVRHADAIVSEEVKKAGWYRRLWQSFAVLLPVQSVGVMGDERTYEYTVAIRAVESKDGMTADWARLPHELLASISSRIVNEVRGINRVVFDISSKPPSTIEWE